MKAKLRHYTSKDNPNEEYVIICTQELDQDEEEDLHLEAEVEITGDFISWPTDRLLEYVR